MRDSLSREQMAEGDDIDVPWQRGANEGRESRRSEKDEDDTEGEKNGYTEREDMVSVKTVNSALQAVASEMRLTEEDKFLKEENPTACEQSSTGLTSWRKRSTGEEDEECWQRPRTQRDWEGKQSPTGERNAMQRV